MTGANPVVRDKKNGESPQGRLEVREIKPESTFDEPVEATRVPSETPITETGYTTPLFSVCMVRDARVLQAAPAGELGHSVCAPGRIDEWH